MYIKFFPTHPQCRSIPFNSPSKLSIHFCIFNVITLRNVVMFDWERRSKNIHSFLGIILQKSIAVSIVLRFQKNLYIFQRFSFGVFLNIECANFYEIIIQMMNRRQMRLRSNKVSSRTLTFFRQFFLIRFQNIISHHDH